MYATCWVAFTDETAEMVVNETNLNIETSSDSKRMYMNEAMRVAMAVTFAPPSPQSS